MSLDIEFTRSRNIVCPKCGDIIETLVVESSASGGRVWYEFLESLGYYVPYDQRTEENDWYGKDMILTEEQVKEAIRFVRTHEISREGSILKLLVDAIMFNHTVVVNADW